MSPTLPLHEPWPKQTSVARSFPKGSMYPNGMYFGLKVVPLISTLGPEYVLFGHMDP